MNKLKQSWAKILKARAEANKLKEYFDKGIEPKDALPIYFDDMLRLLPDNNPVRWDEHTVIRGFHAGNFFMFTTTIDPEAHTNTWYNADFAMRCVVVSGDCYSLSKDIRYSVGQSYLLEERVSEQWWTKYGCTVLCIMDKTNLKMV